MFKCARTPISLQVLSLAERIPWGHVSATEGRNWGRRRKNTPWTGAPVRSHQRTQRAALRSRPHRERPWRSRPPWSDKQREAAAWTEACKHDSSWVLLLLFVLSTKHQHKKDHPEHLEEKAVDENHKSKVKKTGANAEQCGKGGGIQVTHRQQIQC